MTNPAYKDLGLTYEQAAHGIQTAVGYEQHSEKRGGQDHIKHLRTGLDCRAADAMGLATLLIEKGIITQAEYLEHMRLAANTELARYEDHLNAEFPHTTRLVFR